MNDARGRQKLAPTNSRGPGGHRRGLAGLADRGAWISRHPFPCVGLRWFCIIGVAVLSPLSCPSVPEAHPLAEYGGTLFFPCRVVGLEGRVRRSTQPLSSASASGLAVSGQSHPFSPSHLPPFPLTHLNSRHTRLLPSSSRRHLPGRRAFRSLALVVSAIFFGPSATSDSPVLTDRRRRPVTLRRCAALYPHWNITSFVPDALRLKRGIPRN